MSRVTQRHGVWNGSRFRQEDLGGFYESDFQRANHSDRPLAFWIRYTAFRSEGRPDRALGELWAIYFDGETSRITAVKEAVPIYERAFPKAKALVGTPNAVYTGTLTVDGHEIPIDGWRGSQNHNRGSRHTDNYAWGQVAGFDGAPDAFLECATAQLKLGPFWTPRLTLVVLRDEKQETVLNGLVQAVRAFGRFDFFTWTIDTRSRRHASSAVFMLRRALLLGLPEPAGW